MLRNHSTEAVPEQCETLQSEMTSQGLNISHKIFKPVSMAIIGDRRSSRAAMVETHQPDVFG